MENFKRTEDGKGVILPDVDTERYPEASAAYLAKVTFEKDGKIKNVTVPKGRVLPFDKPARRVEAKRLITVKAHRPDGGIVQLPLEGQINNQVASPADFIGLRGFIRKNFTIFFDFETGQPAFCKTWGCYAEALPELDGYCHTSHKGITAPEESSGAFGAGATGTDSMRQL